MFAQDVIVKKDGSHIECRVVEVNDSGVVYKKWSNLNGNNFEIDRADVSSVNYSDGKKMTFSEVNNLYKPGNQNDGTQQLNDRALLIMDYAASNPLKKARNLKTIGWIGGGVLLVASFFLSDMDNDGDFSNDYLSFTAIGAGITFTTICLISAK
jgi:hypothetical protein